MNKNVEHFKYTINNLDAIVISECITLGPVIRRTDKVYVKHLSALTVQGYEISFCKS